MKRVLLVLAVLALASTAYAVTEQSCLDAGGHLYNNHCYIWNPENLVWNDARAACVTNYGSEFDLTSVASRAENDFVSTTVRGSVSPEGRPDYHIGLHSKEGVTTWRWVDGTPFAYQNWGAGEPNQEVERCAHSNWGSGSRHWNDLRCFAHAVPSVCEAPIDYTITPVECDNLGGVLGGSTCYMWNSNSLGWHAAHEACRALTPGAELVSIHSAEQNDFISSQVRPGNLSPNAPGWYWIGMHDLNDEQTFENTDGSPVDYQRWAQGEPNDFNGEDCVQSNFHSLTLHWNDLGCEGTGPSVCAIHVDEDLLVLEERTFEAPCGGCTGTTMDASNPTGKKVTLQFADKAPGVACTAVEL